MIKEITLEHRVVVQRKTRYLIDTDKSNDTIHEFIKDAASYDWIENLMMDFGEIKDAEIINEYDDEDIMQSLSIVSLSDVDNC